MVPFVPFAVPPRDGDAEEQKPRRKPPADYETLPGLGYYKFHTDIKTWDKARDICEKEGAHLAVINSLTEAKSLLSIWIRNVFKDWRKDAAYIGIWDPEGTGEFVTIFSKHFSTLLNDYFLFQQYYHPRLKVNIATCRSDCRQRLD
jgi:hypothetical protein